MLSALDLCEETLETITLSKLFDIQWYIVFFKLLKLEESSQMTHRNTAHLLVPVEQKHLVLQQYSLYCQNHFNHSHFNSRLQRTNH